MPNNKWKRKAPDVLIREHFKSDGTPKTIFQNQQVAEREAWLYGMECYECSFCNKWHLANKEKNV